MLTARALRPLSQTPRLARARLNSSQQRPATEPSTSGHGNTLLMVGVAAVALVAAGKMAYSSRRGDVSGPGDAGKIQPEEVSEAIQDDVEALKKSAENKTKDAIQSAKLDDKAMSTKQVADTAADKIQDAASSAKSKAEDAYSAAKGKVQDATASVQDKASEAKLAALEKIRTAAEPLMGLPGADSVIADLMAQAEKALEGWKPSDKK